MSDDIAIYYECHECGFEILDGNVHAWDDDGNPFCSELCISDYRYSNREENLYGGYHGPYKVKEFMSFGFEWEVELRHDDWVRSAERLRTDVVNLCNYQHLGTKDDCSVSGYEIVTAPFNYQRGRHREVIAAIVKSIGDECYDDGDAGIHVHVSRESFGDTPEEQEATLAKVLFIFERWWDDIVKISRRSEDRIDEWARRYEAKGKNQCFNVAKGKWADGGKRRRYWSTEEDDNAYYGRYYAVNISNPRTVEFRIFNTTTNEDTMNAYIDFLWAVMNAARFDSADVIWRKRFLLSAIGAHATDTLKEYMDSVGVDKPKRKMKKKESGV